MSIKYQSISIRGPPGSGKSTAALMSIGQVVDENVNELQSLYFVYTIAAAIHTKWALDQMYKDKNIKSKIVVHGSADRQDCHVLIGTPLSLIKEVQNYYQGSSFIRLICFDDADVTSRFNQAKTLMSQFNSAQFIMISSHHVTVEPNFKFIMTSIENINERHFYVASEDKLNELKKLIEHCQDRKIIIFTSGKPNE